jgi:hypothetical protein
MRQELKITTRNMGDASIFDERASRTLVDFGVLIDNTIK